MVPAQGATSAHQRKIIWRASHRGLKELDILLGAYARERVPTMSDGDLRDLELLLAVSDNEIYDWLVRGEPVPEGYRNAVLEDLLAYRLTPDTGSTAADE